MWIGICLSNLGYWMQTITAAWLMKEWTKGDPVLVSLVQTAYFLPTVLLIIFSGTLADRLDRRKLLIFANIWMMISALWLAGLVAMGNSNPVMLLSLSALLAIGFSLNQPTQSAIVPELVGIKNIPHAVSLYSIANNGARVLGPGLAGILLPIIGGAAVISINAATYLFLLTVLILWKRSSRAAETKNESFIKSVLSGYNFVKTSQEFKNILIRGSLFFLITSIILALTPMLVENSENYGIVFGCFGIGAIVGATNYARLASYYSRNNIVKRAVIIHAIMLVILSISSNTIVMSFSLLVAGTSWFFVMSALQISAQLILPENFRGRGIAILNMTLMLGYALGSPLWGSMAVITSAKTSMLIAGITSIFILIMTHRFSFPED